MALLFFLCSHFFSVLRKSMTLDTITASQSLSYDQTLSSAGETFEMGFFSLGNSENHYLGIRYKKVPSKTVVWVANRETPLINQSGILNFTDQGILVLFDGENNIVWLSNASKTAQEPVVQLLESGNLVVKDGNDNFLDKFLWQSFDYPCDTLLPGMKLGRNMINGLEWFLSSWKSAEDPAPGPFSLRIDLRGFPQLFLEKGNEVQLRIGSWNGLQFTGIPIVKENSIYSFEFMLNENEVYYKYELLSNSVLSRYELNPSGLAQRFIWTSQKMDWEVLTIPGVELCDNYAYCGAYASCNNNKSPVCSCLEGFMPRSQRDSYAGCVRRTPLVCDNGDDFLKHAQLKLPDTSSSWVNKSMSLMECKELCLRNCSCTAYANSDIRGGGTGCLLWNTDLIDTQEFTEGEQDLYIRMAASELAQIGRRTRSNEKKQVAIIVSSVIIAMGVLVLGLVLCMKKKNVRKQGVTKDMDLPIFDLRTIANATDNFSSNNKLGAGSFGPVYKGELKEGQEIAVKRLSRNSGQGLEEFKNEVILIAKLQHRNLVKLLGYCIQGDEKMLIYEYMPNKSLDYFIFGLTLS